MPFWGPQETAADADGADATTIATTIAHPIDRLIRCPSISPLTELRESRLGLGERLEPIEETLDDPEELPEPRRLGRVLDHRPRIRPRGRESRGARRPYRLQLGPPPPRHHASRAIDPGHELRQRVPEGATRQPTPRDDVREARLRRLELVQHV